MDRLESIPKELISGTISIDSSTAISKADQYLRKYPAIVVNKNKDYYGIIDTRTVYRALHGLKLNGSERIERFCIKAPRVSNSTSIYDLVNYFYKSGVKALPYMHGNRISGVLERKTLLKVLLSLNTLQGIRVGEAMSTPVLAIDANATLAHAKTAMRDRKVNRLIVLQDGRFAGLITNYDIANHYTKNLGRAPERKSEVYSPSNVPIGSVMETNTRSIDQGRALSDAVRELVEGNISSLVVMKGKDAVGVLTITDVFESVLARQRVEASKVLMSGFDANTYMYEDEAREALISLVDHIEKLSGIDVDYITFKVKSTRSRLYEMQARLSLGRHGIITMHTNKYMFDDALNDLVRKLRHKVVKEKESIMAHKKVNALRDAV